MRNVWRIVIVFSVCFIVYLKTLEEEHNSDLLIQENLYSLLDLPYKSSIKDVKKQYQKLSIVFHPDKNPDCKDCQQKMTELTKAYNVLSNEESKREYDKYSSVLKKFQSSAQTLTKFNFENLVIKRQQPYIIIVYDMKAGYNIEELQGFWNDFINQNQFINYGSMEISHFNKAIYPYVKSTPRTPFLVQYLPDG